MAELLWCAFAWIVSRRGVTDYLVKRAQRTPYVDIRSADGTDTYMRRWWLFNPYHDTPGLRRFGWCPISIRVHQILRADQDRHLHDHPWNARSVILAGGYREIRADGRILCREPGDTLSLRHGEFHRIASVDPQTGATTLFITGRYRGVWGFKIPYQEYLEK